jgi:hypothetical protein
MRWPRSRSTQAIIALTLGLIASANEYARFAMASFNNFYFGPHKAYPYPYPDVRSANLILLRNCGLAFGLVFLVTWALQKFLVNRKPN